jgi:tRNA 2-thiouridine synthesizing protein D
MIFTVSVHGSPHGSLSNHHALKFCQAAISQGHGIARVFFYHEGVYTALNTQVTPQDELDINQCWRAFASEHNVELAVCIANGLKRGVLSDSERDRYDRSSTTLADGFELVGLGQLIDAIAQSDRYIEFP